MGMEDILLSPIAWGVAGSSGHSVCIAVANGGYASVFRL